MFKRSLLGLVVAASAAAAVPQAANAQAISAGVLRCTVGAGTGYVVGSRRALTCFYYNAFGERETYDGTISTLGLDVGYTSIGSVAWAVVAPSAGIRGSLEGTYVGAGMQATVAAGLGANGMVGGFQQSINLQPFSISGQEGLNAQIGFTGMTLKMRTARYR